MIMAKRKNNFHFGLWIKYNLEHFVRDGTLGEHVSMDYMP